MNFRQSSVARSIVGMTLAGFALVMPTSAAEANEGFFEALSRIFAPPPQPRYAPRYVPVFVPETPRLSRPRRAARLRIRHASLPGAGKGKAEAVKGKPVVREPERDPVGKLLNDETLRRGDIVVLPGGVKVFKGGATAPYRPSDFEDVRASKLLGDKTRRTLAAMRVQPAAPHVQAENAAPTPGGLSQQAANDFDRRVDVTGSLPRRVGP